MVATAAAAAVVVVNEINTSTISTPQNMFNVHASQSNFVFAEDTQKLNNNNNYTHLCTIHKLFLFSMSNLHVFHSSLHIRFQFVSLCQFQNKKKVIFLLRFFMLCNLTEKSFLCSFVFFFNTDDLENHIASHAINNGEGRKMIRILNASFDDKYIFSLLKLIFSIE